ncbi:MAG: arylsulfatase [Propionibacteriaceae bacterium]|nr:arylsulfatase [Propionibacteriaceae bacterium]
MSTAPEFGGVIGRTFEDSTPWWPADPPHMQTAPNIIVVIYDDTGWSDFGCFGSEIATPTFDALAAQGVRYSNFHVSPLCSPTRASVLTGRNPHRVGMRFLADADTGFPNARGFINHDVPTLPEVLRKSGYGTYLVGKWHLTPLHEITPVGPTDNWPLARGFEKFYGFLDGCTDQYSPELFQDNHQVDPPDRPDYILGEDLADRAIGYIRDHTTYRAGAPFFLQVAPGATHAPFQAPKEYIDKYVDVFRKGWDQTREDRLARQIELGVVPEGTVLTERNPDVVPWDSLDEDAKEVYAHLQAAFAGFLEHSDAQLGRILAEVERLGLTENTIVVAFSDNGASREGYGGDIDTNVAYTWASRPPAEQLPLLDRLGGIKGGAHYPAGWAMAGNTPFRRYKQFVDLGGIRSPLVMSWPGHTAEVNRVSYAFAHAVDIAPTLLDLAGLPPLEDTDGASIGDAIRSAEEIPGRTHQGFEMLGHRALVHDGWVAVTEHAKGTSYDDDTWRLYNLNDDFSQATDLAAEYPEKVAELEKLWWEGAERNEVLPLDDRTLIDLLYHRNPKGLVARDVVTLQPGQGHVPFSSAICGSNRSMVVRANLAAYEPGAEGVLLASGNENSGYTLYIKDARLHFEHHFMEQRVVLSSAEPLGAGDQAVGFALKVDEDKSARVTLLAGPREQESARINRVSGHLSFYGLDVGKDPVSPVSEAYAAPFAFPEAMLHNVQIHFTEELDLDEWAHLLEVTE